MLQLAAYPLALLWQNDLPQNPYYQNTQILTWINASLRHTLTSQHSNGSFDSVGPYTQDHGVTLAMAYLLSESIRVLAGSMEASLVERIRLSVQRACEFALRSEEDYAFISNHQALFALAYHNAYELLGIDRYREQAGQVIERILEQQSPDGWYREYDGPDPGYESLGIFYLAVYWQRTGSQRLLASLQRCLNFYKHFIHPDGSVGGVYGSRHTSMYYPAGFEILAAALPEAAAIARFMRQRLANQNVLTPIQADIHNLPVLCYTYLIASLTPDVDPAPDMPPLPCEVTQIAQDFPDSGLQVRGTRSYYAVVNCRKGGVIRIFDKSSGKVAYEDAGYLLHAKRHLLTSQLIGLGRCEASGTDKATCTTSFARSQQELLTPGRFVLLRLLNLTLFRNRWLGSLIRRLIIGRLIQDQHIAPARLSRSFAFDEDVIRFSDRIEIEKELDVERVSLPRHYTAIHMGSARYFHPAELAALPQVDLASTAAQLSKERKVEINFSLLFSAPTGVELSVETRDFQVDKNILEAPSP